MAKTIEIIKTNGIVKEMFEKHETLSLKKLSDSVGVNYNMMLKAGKQPIPGVPYDPTLLNYEAIETYLRKKNVDVDNLEWTEIATAAAAIRTKEQINWTVGDTLKIRGSEATFRVELITPTHVVFMEVGGTIPRAMSWNTFEHQTPKLVEKATQGKEVK